MSIATLIMSSVAGNITPYLVGSTYGTNSGVSSCSAFKPAGTQFGDLLVAVCQADSSVTWTGDTGWTQVAVGGPTGMRIAYKVATVSEPSIYTFTASISSAMTCNIFAFRCGAFDVAGAFSNPGSTTVTAPSITVSDANSLLLAFFSTQDASVAPTTPSGMTQIAIDSNATSPSSAVFSQQINAGASGTRSSSFGSSIKGCGVLISIKPT